MDALLSRRNTPRTCADEDRITGTEWATDLFAARQGETLGTGLSAGATLGFLVSGFWPNDVATLFRCLGLCCFPNMYPGRHGYFRLPAI